MNDPLHKQVEKTLKSLDETQQLKANPELFSQILAKTKVHDQTKIHSQALYWPLIRKAAMIMILIANFITIYQLVKTENKVLVKTEASTLDYYQDGTIDNFYSLISVSNER